MTKIQLLLQTNLKQDKALAEFIKQRHAEQLIENAKGFNRGDFCEMALKNAPVARDGKHGTSHGDAILEKDGKTLLIEIKYLTKKTSASEALKGTFASHYLLACNDGQNIHLRLLKKEDMKKRIISGAEKIKYQDNFNLGEEINLDKVVIRACD